MDTFEALREKILPLFLPYGVKRLAIFGSFVRGEGTPDSDIDILVVFKEPIGLFRLAHLRQQLETALEKKVDLITEGALSPYIRPFVEKEKLVHDYLKVDLKEVWKTVQDDLPTLRRQVENLLRESAGRVEPPGTVGSDDQPQKT